MARPEMVSFLLLQVVLWLLAGARKNEGRYLWLLVPVMALWVNSHALFSVGAFCIGCAVGGTLAARIPLLPSGWRQASSLGPEATRRLFLSAGAAALVTLLNPYFLEGLLFPLELMSRFDVSNAAFQTIGEFRRPFSGYFLTFSIGAFQAFFFLSIAVICLAAVAGWRAPKKARASTEAQTPGFDLAWALIFIGLVCLSVMARRNMCLFALGATPIVGASLALIGAIDDLVKLRSTANGISARAKLAAQFAVATVVAVLLYQHHVGLPDGLQLRLPLVGSGLSLGVWFVPLAVIVIVGEIFMRDNAYCNGFLKQRLENLGAETMMAPAREWIELSSVRYREESNWRGEILNVVKARIQGYFQTRISSKYEHALAEAIDADRVFPVEELLEAALVEELAMAPVELETMAVEEAELAEGRSAIRMLLVLGLLVAVAVGTAMAIREVRRRREEARERELVAVPVEPESLEAEDDVALEAIAE